MLQNLVPLLPGALAHPSPAVALSATAGGAVLWVGGGRFSRAVVTLMLVAAGAWLGLHLPRWMNWPVQGPAVGVLGALGLGAAGYYLDRTFTGVLLGAVLAVWAGMAVWLALAPVASAHEWSWPVPHWTSDPIDLVAQLWRGLPDELARTMPLACACGLVAGILVGLLWPRVGRAMLFSLLGVSLVLAVGLPGAAQHRPDWVAALPASATSQVELLLGLVAAGTVLQWGLIRATEHKPRLGKAKAGDASPDAEDRPVREASGRRPTSRTGGGVDAAERLTRSRPTAKSSASQPRPGHDLPNGRRQSRSSHHEKARPSPRGPAPEGPEPQGPERQGPDDLTPDPDPPPVVEPGRVAPDIRQTTL